MDLHFLIFIFPAGIVLGFKQLRDEHVFMIIYALVVSYFTGVMVRLMLTLTPIVCVSAAVALSNVFDTYINPMEPEVLDGDKADESKKEKSTAPSASGTFGVEFLTGMVTSGLLRPKDYPRFPCCWCVVVLLSVFFLFPAQPGFSHEPSRSHGPRRFQRTGPADSCQVHLCVLGFANKRSQSDGYGRIFQRVCWPP
jgi:hypothetical protein